MHFVQMRVPGRVVLESHVGALQTVLDRAHGLTAGQKIVTGLGSVLNTVIAVSDRNSIASSLGPAD